MFASDTNLFISDSNIENLYETMNEELQKVAIWFKARNLSLNISKAKYYSFHCIRKRKDSKYFTSIAHRQHSNQKRI